MVGTHPYQCKKETIYILGCSHFSLSSRSMDAFIMFTVFKKLLPTNQENKDFVYEYVFHILH